MSLKLRLARRGSKKRPFYHIVVAENTSPRDGRFIEKLGFFNPMVPKDSADRLRLDQDRANYWMSVGAKPTDRVARFMASLGMMEARPIPTQTKKNQPGEKAKAQAEKREAARLEAEEAKKAAEQAKSAPAEATPPAEEPPAEEPPADEAPAEEPPAEEPKA